MPNFQCFCLLHFVCLLCCEDRDGAGIGAFSLCISLCFLKVRMILEEELCFLYESKAS